MGKADVSKFLRTRSGIVDTTNEFVEPEMMVEPDPEELLASPPCCQHGAPCKLAVVKKSGPNTGRYFYACAAGKKHRCKFFEWAEVKKSAKVVAPPNDKVKLNNGRAISSYLRRNDVTLYMDCRLTRDFEKPADNLEVQQYGKRQLLVELNKQDTFSSDVKGEIWLLSSSLLFPPSESVLVKVTSNIMMSTNRASVRLLSGNLQNIEEEETFVLKLCSSLTDFNVLEILSKQVYQLPLLRHLLFANKRRNLSTGLKLSSVFTISTPQPSSHHKPAAVVGLDYNDMMILSKQYAKEYNLDPNQASVLNSVAEVLKDHGRSTSPIVLVDGVAGSGKTMLLCLSILFLHEVIHSTPNDDSASCSSTPKKWKVLATGSSDAQVDRILTSLLQLGFDNLARVGDVGAIKPSLLPYSVHHKGGSNEQLKKLKNLLRHNANSQDKLLKECGRFLVAQANLPDGERFSAASNLQPRRARHIQKAIDQIESGATKRLLHKAFVVGVTCQSSLSTSLGYYKFPFVVMDDAHVIDESHALLPLANFACEKLLMAGDHCLQLTNHKASRTLFQRLIEAGHESILLRNQYRYHSEVSSLLNRVLYDGVINDVTDENDALIEGLPRICMCDVPGKEEQLSPGDCSNMEEVKLIADLIKYVLSNGVPGSCIVVMTTYEAQAVSIRRQLRDIELPDMSDVECVDVITHAHYDGVERKVLLLSTVGPTRDTCDVIRLLSCATHHVIVVGNVSRLSSDTMWRNVIDFLRGTHDGLQTIFHFRQILEKFFEKLEANSLKELASLQQVADMTSQASVVLSEEDDVLNSSDDHCSVDDDVTDDNYDAISTQDVVDNDDVLMTCNDEQADDDIPLLRHKRKRFCIDDDESPSDTSQVT